ncbi:unnamed protein product [Knipowitschia caucasica]|uniref:Proprotein convertase subtilisin/kexin type 1 inhibitor, like n=1 Tax=Knipowitschia caucasica TaxID=637954 RepID=A0AAV2LXT3_KNICA
MEPARVLVLLAALLHSAQCVPVGMGRGLDDRGGVRRARREVLPYEDRMMSLAVPEEDWRGRGLEQALQRLVERDQRREQQQEQQQRAAYMSAMMQLLADAERAGLVNAELDQDQEESPAEIKTIPDYDDMSPRLTMSRPQAPWWRLVEPQLAEALLQRLDPDFAEALLNKLQQTQRPGPRETDEETLRRLIGQILSSLDASDSVRPSSRRMRRDLSDSAPSPLNPSHKRSRRSLDDAPPSADPPLLRVKRLEEEEELEPRSLAGLQRIKRIDLEDHGSRRRKRRAVVNYDPQILLRQALELMRE